MAKNKRIVFCNWKPFPCGCRMEFHSGHGEYSDSAEYYPCELHAPKETPEEWAHHNGYVMTAGGTWVKARLDADKFPKEEIGVGMYNQYALQSTLRPLLALVEEYHQRTEAYDRTVCTGPIRDGAILPRNGRELALINKNAKVVLNDVLQRVSSDEQVVLRQLIRDHRSKE